MNDDTNYVELKCLGGSSKFHQSHLVFKNSEKQKTILIEGQPFIIKSFQWIERETRD